MERGTFSIPVLRTPCVDGALISIWDKLRFVLDHRKRQTCDVKKGLLLSYYFSSPY